MQLAEQVRGADLENTRRPLLVFGNGLLDLVQVFDDLRSALVVEIAKLGQR